LDRYENRIFASVDESAVALRVVEEFDTATEWRTKGQRGTRRLHMLDSRYEVRLKLYVCSSMGLRVAVGQQQFQSEHCSRPTARFYLHFFFLQADMTIMGHKNFGGRPHG
jgi:hypothetical protein